MKLIDKLAHDTIKLALKKLEHFGEDQAKNLRAKHAPEAPQDEFNSGLEVELEHGTKAGPVNNVTGDDPDDTASIAGAHLKEMKDYYTRLDKMEAEGKKAASVKLADEADEPTPDKISDEQKSKILSFVKEHPDVDDEMMHELFDRLSVNPHVGETAIYRAFQKDNS